MNNPHDASIPTPPGPDAQLPEAAPGRRGRVLFADDDELFRSGLAALLTQDGYECICAGSGEEASQLLRRSDFDAFLSDIDMPGNARLELIEQIPQIADGLPIILITGRPTVETAARSVRLPVTAYLMKPPSFDELRQLLRQSIADYRSYRAVHATRERLQRWDQELDLIEKGFRANNPLHAQEQVAGFTRLTLRNVMMTLVELESSLVTLDPLRPGGDLLHKIDVVGALRHTITVLERTKQNFKSKDLAALRKQLEILLTMP